MGSEITAATISNNIGQVRRDPFAMLPFTGYHQGDYLNHWLKIGAATQSENLPKLYYVNWFRKNNEGKFLWPGYGENSRVLKWIFERTEHTANALKTAIGWIPSENDLDLNGLNLKPESIQALLHVDKAEWLRECDSIDSYYQSFGDRLPKAIARELAELKVRLRE